MKELLEYLSEQIKSKSILVQMLVGLGTIVSSIYSFTNGQWHLSIFLLLIIFALLIYNSLNFIIKAEREIFGERVEKFSLRARNMAKKGKMLVAILIPLSSLYILYDWVRINTCDTSNTAFGIIVTNFKGSEGDDEFSGRLFSQLTDDLSNNDSVIVKPSDDILKRKDSKDFESLKAAINKKCFNRGFVIYGNRDEESKSFDCNIYIEGFEELSNRPIIYIKNPDVISFSIDNQAEVIAEFVLALLYSHSSESMNMAKNYLKQTVELNSNSRNGRFIAWCNFLQGNIDFKQGNYLSAAKYYEMGIKMDSSIGVFHYNQAMAFLQSQDTINSLASFARASKIDASLVGPKLVMRNKRVDEHKIYSQEVSKADDRKPVRDTSLLQIIKNNSSYDLIERGGRKILVSQQYISKSQVNSHPFFVVEEKDMYRALFVYRINNRWIIDSTREYSSSEGLATSSLSRNPQGYAVIIKKDNLSGLVNLKGDTLLRPIYTYVCPFISKRIKYYIYSDGKKYGAFCFDDRSKSIPMVHPTEKYLKEIIPDMALFASPQNRP